VLLKANLPFQLEGDVLCIGVETGETITLSVMKRTELTPRTRHVLVNSSVQCLVHLWKTGFRCSRRQSQKGMLQLQRSVKLLVIFGL